MFLLRIGELLEEWTHKKSVENLARSMALNVDRVWLRTGEGEVLVSVDQVEAGDLILVRTGGLIPLDGRVAEGEAMVNQASLTGESLPVRKERDGYVYAGTVLEEGELTVQVEQTSGSTRFEKIVTMIEDSCLLYTSSLPAGRPGERVQCLPGTWWLTPTRRPRRRHPRTGQ